MMSDLEPAVAIPRIATRFRLFRTMNVLERRDAGLAPWNYDRFAAWSKREYGKLSDTEASALSFVWCLLHGGRGAPVPPFDLRSASRFDDTNKKAFAAWVEEGMPFW